jgi:hypothetical protein
MVKCTPEARCPEMAASIIGTNANAKGITKCPLIDFKTGKEMDILIYTLDPKKLMFLPIRFCPFCGVKYLNGLVAETKKGKA